ncbi:MAG TPA: hypothetical protein VFS00_30515, partial [Polyangiaceae bacterium]|nr:hypothetical protein [Polyangiaceae bacterium]
LVLDHSLALEPSREAPSPRAEARAWGLAVEGRAGGEVGLLGGVGAFFAVGVETGRRPGRSSFGAGAFGVSPASVEYDLGAIDLSLFGAYVRGCRVFFGAPGALRGGFCALGLLGALGGKGRGYPGSNRQAYTTWVAPGLAASLRGPLGGAFDWSLTATGYVPLLRGGFSIGNRGQAYETGPAAASLEAGVSWTIL